MPDASRTTFKVQTLAPDLGWVFATGAGVTLWYALSVLESYDRNWPSERHRLVSVDAKGNIEVVQEGTNA